MKINKYGNWGDKGLEKLTKEEGEVKLDPKVCVGLEGKEEGKGRISVGFRQAQEPAQSWSVNLLPPDSGRVENASTDGPSGPLVRYTSMPISEKLETTKF